MIKKLSLALTILFSTAFFISCENTEVNSTEITENEPADEIVQESKESLDISGVYRRIKKVDEVNKDETIYDTDSQFYKIGLDISKENGAYVVNSTEIAEDNSSTISEYSRPKTLKQTDDEIYQHKSKDGIDVYTYYFSQAGIEIAEFIKDDSGNFKKESTVFYDKIK